MGLYFGGLVFGILRYTCWVFHTILESIWYIGIRKKIMTQKNGLKYNLISMSMIITPKKCDGVMQFFKFKRWEISVVLMRSSCVIYSAEVIQHFSIARFVIAYNNFGNNGVIQGFCMQQNSLKMFYPMTNEKLWKVNDFVYAFG